MMRICAIQLLKLRLPDTGISCRICVLKVSNRGNEVVLESPAEQRMYSRTIFERAHPWIPGIPKAVVVADSVS